MGTKLATSGITTRILALIPGATIAFLALIHNPIATMEKTSSRMGRMGKKTMEMMGLG
jgi:hypothetical protein